MLSPNTSLDVAMIPPSYGLWISQLMTIHGDDGGKRIAAMVPPQPISAARITARHCARAK